MALAGMMRSDRPVAESEWERERLRTNQHRA
jgi:hypothetical protein